MPDLQLSLLIFAPATVGLIVTVLRRLPPSIYWASLGGISILALASVAPTQLAPGSLEISSIAFTMLFVIVPTVVAFCAGRLVLLDRGGAWIFTATSSAYLFGLGLAAALSAIPKALIP